MRGRPVGSKNKELPGAPDLLVIPRRIKKEIANLAAASGVSPAQVLVDILDGGLINAREMYRTLIEYRKSLREQLEDNGADVEPETEPEGEAKPHEGLRNGNGSATYGLGAEAGESISELRPIEVGSDLAPVGPGQFAEGDTTLNGDRGDAS